MTSHRHSVILKSWVLRTLVWSLLLTPLFSHIWIAPSFSAEQSQRPNAVTTFAPTILSIIPAQAEPGSRVIIFGSGFGDRLSVYLGNVEIPALVTEGKQLEFIVPNLDAGLYALYLRRGDGGVGRVYNFNVLPLRPVLKTLSPDQVDSCAKGKDREVIAVGEHFTGNSLLLFDGAVIKSRIVSREAIAFAVPQIAGGMHQVAVRNGMDNESVAVVALVIVTQPEINHITVGNEFVNYYELYIEGRNFQQNSAIYVDGHRIGGNNGLETGERDRLIYYSCNKLVYQRYPYSSVNKDLRIQVINPDNEASRVVNVSAP